MARLECQRALDGGALLIMESQGIEARRQVRPEGRMTRVGERCTLKQLPGPGGIPTLQQLLSPLVQDGRVVRGKLRCAREQLLGLAAAARGCGGSGGLDDFKDGGRIGCHEDVCAFQRYPAEARGREILEGFAQCEAVLIGRALA